MEFARDGRPAMEASRTPIDPDLSAAIPSNGLRFESAGAPVGQLNGRKKLF